MCGADEGRSSGLTIEGIIGRNVARMCVCVYHCGCDADEKHTSKLVSVGSRSEVHQFYFEASSG